MTSNLRTSIDSILNEDKERFRVSPRRCYCSLLYGAITPFDLLTKALAMAHSIRASTYGLIIMITPDVSAEVRDLIKDSGLFIEVRIVDYIFADKRLFKKDWFREVFTKFHVFNLVEYSTVIFLDLDVIVNNVPRMDLLFESDFGYAAMENSKGSSAASMWLEHGDLMGRHCKLINAGVIMASPNRKLFELLTSHVTSASDEHVPGMTPEQFYLARILGHRFHHLSQRYNMEVQLHGGVPITPTWVSCPFEEVVLFHFSGCDPLKRVASCCPEWACQSHKRMVKEKWESEFDQDTRTFLNERARKAFGQWAFHFGSAIAMVKKLPYFSLNVEMERIGDMLDSENMIVSVSGGKIQTVNIKKYSLHFPRPSRNPPPLISVST